MKKVILEIVKESEEQDKYIGHGFYGMYDISFKINLNGKNLKDILFDKNEWIKNKEYEIGMHMELGDEYDFLEEEYDYIINNIDHLYDMIDLVSIDDEIDIY